MTFLTIRQADASARDDGRVPIHAVCRALADQLALQLRADRALRLACLTILIATLTLIAIAVALDLVAYLRGLDGGGPPPALDLSIDNSLPERLMQGCALLASITLAWCAWRHRISACLGLAGIYLFIVFDDALSYHERIGTWFTKTLPISPAFGMRAQETGEILAWAIAGAVLIVPLVRSWIRDAVMDRAVLGLFGLCLIALGLAGAVFDMLHIVVTTRGIGGLLGIAEDGGEMIAVAAAACLALSLARLLATQGMPGLAGSRPAQGDAGAPR